MPFQPHPSDAIPDDISRHFATTEWSLVLAVGDFDGERARGALADVMIRQFGRLPYE
jgi:hypothetical protein